MASSEFYTNLMQAYQGDEDEYLQFIEAIKYSSFKKEKSSISPDQLKFMTKILDSDKKRKAELVTKMYRSLFNSNKATASIAKYEKAHNRLGNLDEFVKKLFKESNISKDLMSLPHIVEGDHLGGRHTFKYLNEENFRAFNTNPKTGVSSGKVTYTLKGKNKTKISSIFPPEVRTKVDILKLFNHAEKVDVTTNRGVHLYKIGKEKFNELFNAEIKEDLYFQAYVSDRQFGVPRLSSIFPCLFFNEGSDSKNLDINIDGKTYTIDPYKVAFGQRTLFKLGNRSIVNLKVKGGFAQLLSLPTETLNNRKRAINKGRIISALALGLLASVCLFTPSKK